MERLGFSEGLRASIFNTVVGLLHLGNIEFAPDKDGSTIANDDVPTSLHPNC